jgi:hypothetical protein
MIIRHKHKNRFVVVPNRIFDDKRLSLAAKGLLIYLLSLPPSWEVRHDQLQRKLCIGRKLLDRLLRELIVAGYVTRDDEQGRDEQNRFTTLNYVVSDIPSNAVPDAPSAVRRAPKREKDTGNNKKDIKTDFTNPFSKSPPNGQAEPAKAWQDEYSQLGRHALGTGQHAVFVGSKPYEAWLEYRGLSGMPGFVDRAVIGGRSREIVWMPSLYPPHHPKRGI